MLSVFVSVMSIMLSVTEQILSLSIALPIMCQLHKKQLSAGYGKITLQDYIKSYKPMKILLVICEINVIMQSS